MESIFAAFTAYECANTEAGALLLKSKKAFWGKAEEWTQLYACSKNEATDSENSQ